MFKKKYIAQIPDTTLHVKTQYVKNIVQILK